MISDRSRYSDDAWSWYDPSNPRLAHYHKSKLRIDWTKLLTHLDLSPEIIEDLKKYAFLRYAHSKVVFPRTKKNAHPASVCQEINTLAKFLSHLRKHMFGDGYLQINALSEVETSDIENALSTYPRKNAGFLRFILQNLASERLNKYLGCGQLRWNEHDVAAFEWNIKEREHYQRLPDGAFRLLSNAATADVKQFLTAIGAETQDTTGIGHGDNLYLSAFGNFREFFNDYLRFCVALKREKDGAVRSKYVMWVRSLGEDVGRLAKLVDRARMAAQVIVVMYTGARSSELSSFKTDCLRRRGDAWVMVGTLYKQQDIHAPVDQDEWVAIPIVRDAVRLLEEVGRAAGSDYLFHGSCVQGAEPKRMDSSHLCKHRLTPYLRLVDVAKRWEHLRPHTHQFRNSLVFEMRKAGLGIPFITHQLKHLFNELEGKANNTTLIYGGIGSEAAHMAVEEANLEAIREIYHPDAPVAGGGAEEHKRRRAAYFQGMTAHEVDKVLLILAREHAMPMTDVGLAYCGGKKKIEEIDGTLTDPPCIGGLRCNPFRCKQGIITLHKRPVWKTMAVQNRHRAQDPEFAYAKAELEEAANEAEAVVRSFDDDAVVRFLDGQKRRKDGE